MTYTKLFKDKNDVKKYRNAEIRKHEGHLFLDDTYYEYESQGFWNKKEHTVIATDYDNFAVIYGCEQNLGTYHTYATLLSRSKHLSSEYID